MSIVQLSIVQMSIGQMSIVQMSIVLKSIVQMSIVLKSIGQMSIGEMFTEPNGQQFIGQMSIGQKSVRQMSVWQKKFPPCLFSGYCHLVFDFVSPGTNSIKISWCLPYWWFGPLSQTVHASMQGTLTEGEGSVPLTSLY